MSIFAKKSDPEPGSNAYGIAEAIQLLRSLPNDQDSDLIVRVVRSTLESLNIHLPDIIDDATRKERVTEERIAAVHIQVGELEEQLQTLRHEIATLESDLKETSDVKARLQMAEKGPDGAHPMSIRTEPTPTLTYGQSVPPLPGGARLPGTPRESPADTASHKD